MTAGMAAPMGGGMPMDPSMGGMPPPGGMPMDPSMGGMPPPGGMPMDPSMGGMPMDPSMGGMPMDPSMGGMPPPDPAAMGGDPAAVPGQIVMSPEEFARVLQVVAGAGGGGGGGDPVAGAEAKPKKVSTDAKLDAVIQALGIQIPNAGPTGSV